MDRVHLRELEAFGFLVLKYAFSHILEITFSHISDIYFNTKDFQFVLFEKWYADQSKAEIFLNLNYEK